MHRFFRAVTVAALAVGAADMSLATAAAAAQAPAATAKPWSPARLPDGQPDVQGEGFWSADIGTDEADDIEKGSDVLHAKMAGRPVMPSDMIVDPPDHTIPYTPAALAIKNRRFASRHDPNLQLRDPIFRCLLAGVPRFEFLQPFRIIQNPGYVLFLYQYEHAFRVIPLDGRPHLEENIKLWRGDSRGRWEGNTLVVDVTNFTPKTDFQGSRENLHLIERWTRVDANTIDYTVTMQDPTTWTKAWTIKQDLTRQPEQANRLYKEPRCHEGNYGMPALLAGARAEEKAFAAGRGPDPATLCSAGCGGFEIAGVGDLDVEDPRPAGGR